MKATFKFSIQSLLYEENEGSLTGAMSPLLFVQEMTKQTDMTFNLLTCLSLC